MVHVNDFYAINTKRYKHPAFVHQCMLQFLMLQQNKTNHKIIKINLKFTQLFDKRSRVFLAAQNYNVYILNSVW